jgi:epoxyqueuosine reductase
LKAAIQQRARELGFDDCRFTTVEPPANSGHFERWLAAKRHGDMAWLERTARKRCDPTQVLAEAKTIVCLAVAYGNSEPAVSEPQFENQKSKIRNRRFLGLTARYARYTDYHDVISTQIKSLTGFLNELAGDGTRSLWYVDTGPFLERDLAQRSGLGFVGKHTNLISRRLGNWIFLAEIITTANMPPDSPEKNYCGSCARCITACPTAAITAPFQLDARRCISYLTIELKGSIPIELRPAIGNRIYGCDDCLAVCPWNRFAQQGNVMKTHAKPELAAPDLLELLALDDPGFKRRFAGTTILRTKRRGLLRNVCVALGNIADTTALPSLERAAQDHEALVAEHARWAMQQIEARQSQALARTGQ